MGKCLAVDFTLTNRSPCQPLWNPQLSRPVPERRGAWMSPRPAPGYLGRRWKWARPARGLKSLAISEAAAPPHVSGCGKGSRENLGPRPSSTGSIIPGREDASHTYPLPLPSLPKEPLNLPLHVNSSVECVSHLCHYVKEKGY